MSPDLHLTTSLLWRCVSIMLIVDILLILLARQLVSRERFQQMRWMLVIAAGVFYFLMWVIVLLWGWDWFYVYIFPAWGRYLLPLIFAAGYSLLALGMFWLSLKLPSNPAVNWCLLGGAEGLLSHIYAIFGLGAASKPPIMQGTDPFIVLLFAVFEKAFYWCLILLSMYFLSKILRPRLSLN
ncbi:MAG: hypothetical protein WAV05_04385 [Anaerolineales bacterium]